MSVTDSATESLPLAPQLRPASPFEAEIFTVLQALRRSVADTLSEIGNFGKPADLHKTLGLDRTLARQLFRLASTAEPLGNGGMIPSRTSMDRFLRIAQTRGASVARITSVNNAYSAFERVVELHAGDRATFNSMVTAATDIDEDWLAVDLQHRRNAFRAMSHTLGIQAKARLQAIIVHANPDGQTTDNAYINGYIGLRVLRSITNAHIFGVTIDHLNSSDNSSCEPLNLSPAGGGYILEEFSSSPLPALAVQATKTDDGIARSILLEKPPIGNFGSTNLFFGLALRGIPIAMMDTVYNSTNQPVETLFIDALTSPGLHPEGIAIGKAMVGWQNKFVGKPVALEGNFNVQHLGHGPRALATLEIPRYTDLLDATAAKLQWDLQHYDAWRIRVDFPIYLSTVSIQWPHADRQPCHKEHK